MNPFETARAEAIRLRTELEGNGVNLEQRGYSLLVATCKALDVSFREVKANFHLLKGADATIIIGRK